MNKLPADKATCLLLDKRYDNFEHISDTISKYIDIEPFIVGDGTRDLVYSHIDIDEIPPRLIGSSNYPTWHTKQCYNAYLSHRKILEKAYKEKIDVLLLEDDVFLEPDFEDIWNSSSKFFKENPWDMLYFGCYHSGMSEKITDNIYRLFRCAGWHAVIIKWYMIPPILNYGPIGPMDEICHRYIQPNYLCYGIYPSIISQCNGYSFIEQGNLDKPSRYKL